jgi:hypothetical protein
VPIREEQLQERLGERFRELDVPLLVEWPDGRRAALLFVLEEETDPARFSIHRLAHYCLELAELFATERIVPVVIFLRPGGHPASLRLGGDAHSYLEFRYLACALAQIPARDYLASDNLVARLNLPNMAYPPEDKVEVYAQAVRGLLALEPHPEKRLKYLDFIDIYADLDDNQRQDYATRYPREATEMSGFAERFIEQGKQAGIKQGLQQGLQQATREGLRHQRHMLTRLVQRRFGADAARPAGRCSHALPTSSGSTTSTTVPSTVPTPRPGSPP